MATNKAPAAPAAKPQEAPQAIAGAAPAPKVDPGPPPAFPAAPAGGHFGIDRLVEAGRLRERETVHAIQTMRLGPTVAKFKAEVLAWMDAVERYEEKLVGKLK